MHETMWELLWQTKTNKKGTRSKIVQKLITRWPLLFCYFFEIFSQIFLLLILSLEWCLFLQRTIWNITQKHDRNNKQNLRIENEKYWNFRNQLKRVLWGCKVDNRLQNEIKTHKYNTQFMLILILRGRKWKQLWCWSLRGTKNSLENDNNNNKSYKNSQWEWNRWRELRMMIWNTRSLETMSWGGNGEMEHKEKHGDDEVRRKRWDGTQRETWRWWSELRMMISNTKRKMKMKWLVGNGEMEH